MIRTDELVIHMPQVQAAERDLRDLGLLWQMIEASAAISCPADVATILPTLASTRQRFELLRGQLVERMVAEQRAQLADTLGALAQCSIDILVRNLYERTADVGFLATDDTLRAYCAAHAAGPTAEARATMVARLAEYQAKYSVYDDVLLLSPQGRVLARLDAADALQQSQDPLLAEALSARSYVERYRPSDLAAAGQPAALLYAHRIDDARGQALGVLVLRFRFADELQRIFGDALRDSPQVVLALVDEARQVLASSDASQVAPGSRLALAPADALALVGVGSSDCLAVCRAGTAYQAYAGPRWRAQAMVSLPRAFRRREMDTGADQAPASAADVPMDGSALSSLVQDADTINRDVRRAVWNGQLLASAPGSQRASLKAVLQQISHSGQRTRERVAQAIADIGSTTLGRAERQAAALARLAADVLDRNLYERANDCRWWALSPVLRQVLAESADGPGQHAGTAALCSVLEHIHGLYTVYSRLLVFDTAGRVRGSSLGGPQDGLIGTPVAPAWREALGALADSQRYAVSAFEDTPLHAHGKTYVFLAAVRADAPGGRLLGGMAIIFHAARELAAMLQDVLGGRSGVAAFVAADGQVLAATDLPLAQALAQRTATALPAGSAGIVQLDGVHYALCRLRGGGYREYNTGDAHQSSHNTSVTTLVALRLGQAAAAAPAPAPLLLAPAGSSAAGETRVALASFAVGSSVLALPATAVVQVIASKGLVQAPQGGGAKLGMIEADTGDGRQLIPVLDAGRLLGVGAIAAPTASAGLVLVLRSDSGRCFGLRIDDVGTVLDVPQRQLQPRPEGLGRVAPWVSGLVDCATAGGGRQLLQLLAVQPLAAMVL